MVDTDVRHRNHVTVTGDPDGPVVVLAHGFGCDQNMWCLVVPRPAGRCKVVLFDQVGSGRSGLSAWVPERYASLDGHAQDAVDVLRALDLRRVTFVGRPVSATAGVLAARAAPDRIGSPAMVAPSPCHLDDDGYRGGFTAADVEEPLASPGSNHLGRSSATAPVVMGDPDRPEPGREPTDSFCATDPAMARVFARTTFLSDARGDLEGVKVPTPVLERAEDAIAPREGGAFVRSRVPGARLVTPDATGHCPRLSAPEATADALLYFLDRVHGTRRAP